MNKNLEKWYRAWLRNDIENMIDQSGPYTKEDIEKYNFVETTVDTTYEAAEAVMQGETGYHITAFMPGDEDTNFSMCKQLLRVPSEELRAIIVEELNNLAEA